MAINFKIEQKQQPVWVGQDIQKQGIDVANDIFTGSKVKEQQKKQQNPTANLPLKDRWADEEQYGNDEIKSKVLTRAKKFNVNVEFDKDGMPINPMGKVGIKGQGVLGKWGPNFAADLVPFVIDKKGNILQVVIERKDGTGKAMIGGFIDPEDNSIKSSALREGFEEALTTDKKTANKLSEQFLKNAIQTPMISNGDGRNTDNSWMMTSVVCSVISPELTKNIKVEGKDDASSAKLEKVTPKLYNSMQFASHGALIVNQWKGIEGMLAKELQNRLNLGYITKEGFNNGLSQLKSMRNEIIKTNGASEVVYSEDKFPELTFRKLPELKPTNAIPVKPVNMLNLDTNSEINKFNHTQLGQGNNDKDISQASSQAKKGANVGKSI